MAMSINGTSGVTFPDASVQTTAPAIPPGTILNTQIFTSSGTWTKPGTGTYVFIRLWAGGGGGGKNATSASGPSGGTGGPFFCTRLLMSDMPSTVSVTVGAGGVGRSTAGNTEVAGGASWFGTRIPVTSMVVGTTYVIAERAQASTTSTVWSTITGQVIYEGDTTGAVFRCAAVGTGSGQVANPKVYAQASTLTVNGAFYDVNCYYGQFPYGGSETTFVIPQYDRITDTYAAATVVRYTQACPNINMYNKPENSFFFPYYGNSTPYNNWNTIFAGACGGGYITGAGFNGIPSNTIYGGAGGAGGTTVSGTNGTAPGGGGGATNTGTKGGDGAAGRVEVYVY